MRVPVSRRSVLWGMAALPLTCVSMPPAAAISNSTAGFGALVKVIDQGAISDQWPAVEYSARVYERGISVTRRGLTMSRQSVLGLASGWNGGMGFPVQEAVLQDYGGYVQRFSQGDAHWGAGRDATTLITRYPSSEWETRTFKDVSPAHDFYRHIEILAKLGVIQGWPDGTFRPQAPVLRDAFAAFCYRLKGSPAYTPPARSPFKDVSPGNIFYKEICWSRSRGIVNGWPDGTYKPLEPIKRDAIAAMLYRMAPATAYTFTPPQSLGFVDVQKSTIFYREMEWMRSTGIATGWVNNPSTGTTSTWKWEYRPLRTATRAEAAAFLLRWHKLFGTL